MERKKAEQNKKQTGTKKAPTRRKAKEEPKGFSNIQVSRGFLLGVAVLTAIGLAVASLMASAGVTERADQIGADLVMAKVAMAEQVADAESALSEETGVLRDQVASMGAERANMADEIRGLMTDVSDVDAMLSKEIETRSAFASQMEVDLASLESRLATGLATGSVGEVSEEAVWWYKLQCALGDPKMVRVALAGPGDGGSFAVNETIYLKDYAGLCLTQAEQTAGARLTGGFVYGHIMSLPPGTYYLWMNSGVMYVTKSDVESITYDPVERYYKRLRYLLEHKPDIVIKWQTSGLGRQDIVKNINVASAGSVLSYSGSATGFVVSNLYLDKGNGDRKMNAMGLAVYDPSTKTFSYTLNTGLGPLALVPIPAGYNAGLHIIHNSSGFSYYKVHHCPSWW